MHLSHIGNELGCERWAELQNNTRAVKSTELLLINFRIELEYLKTGMIQ